VKLTLNTFAIITVTESEIIQAMRRLVLNTKMVVEPSGAVTAAAFMFHSSELPGAERTVAVISGGSVEPEFLAKVITEQ
jgi:threonine dehydratase